MPHASVGVCASTQTPIELCYETFGDPLDDPILLIMGLGTQLVAWRAELCENLASAGFYVIRFDNRDVGLSTHLDHVGSPNVVINFCKTLVGLPASCCYTLSDMAADAVGLLDALGLPAAHVVGASMGGMIAQVLALEHPHRVKSLCCIMSSTGEPDLPRPHLSVVWKMSRPLPTHPEKRVEHMVNILSLISSPVHFDPEAARVYVKAAQARSTYRAGFPRQSAAIMAAPGRRKALSMIQVPSLVIHGKMDPLVPFPHGEDLEKSLPDAMTLFLEDMGHDLSPPLLPAMVTAIVTNCRRVPQLAKALDA